MQINQKVQTRSKFRPTYVNFISLFIYYWNYLLQGMIQKKVGIRLRHLEGPSQTSRYPNPNNVEQPSFDLSRRRQRSPSPMNRRKIFAKPNDQYQYQQPQHIAQYKPPLQNQRPIQNPRQNNNFGSPLMNAQYNTHLNNNLNEYQSEVERLIESLKKKSIELEKKQEIITKLRREIQILKAQNGTYMEQIKTLKAQLQFERASGARNHQPQINQSSRINKGIHNQQEYNLNLRNRYNNEPYQQFAPTPDRQPQQNYNPRDIKTNTNSNSNKNVLPQQKVKRNHMEMQNKQQDSIMSDYLSPLMVLNQPTSKNPSSNPFKEKSIGSKSIKSNSRIQYDAPQRQQQAPQKNFDEQRFNIRLNISQNNLYSSQNPFSKKNFYQQNLTRETQSPPKFGYETAGHYQDRPQNTQNYNRGQVQKRWPTLESSAAHFNTNFLQQISPQSRNPIKDSPLYKKQLTIQDSKQFRFEDFDFSQLDNSQMSNF